MGKVQSNKTETLTLRGSGVTAAPRGTQKRENDHGRYIKQP